MPLTIKYDFICFLNFVIFNLKLNVLYLIHFSSNLAFAEKICFYDFCRALVITISYYQSADF